MLQKITSRMLTVKELFAFFWQNKLWWGIPLVAVLLIFAFLIFFSQSGPLIPIMYTLF